MPKIVRRQPVPSDFGNSIPLALQRILSSRGVNSEEDLDYRLQNLFPPALLKGIDAAVELLADALQAQQRILIVGDFDADGATSCALSILVLRAMGLRQVEFLVPNRFEYGYGLTPEIVDVAREYDPQLIVTVDNGIASIDGVAHAKALGIKVIITDHHLPAHTLPDADAIVNPNQHACEFPSKNLAGVGVIFYLLTALRSRLREIEWFQKQHIAEPNMAEFLDLVALGTVADVVPLDRNNRILVQQGLQRVRSGLARPGILALLRIAGKSQQSVSSQDFGFILGPRLNAAGRLDDISIGIQCLLTEDEDVAFELAAELDALNKERKAIESSMKAEALTTLENLSLNQKQLPWGLSLYDDTWHQGVVGILASRIKDKYHRPVIAFAKVDDQTIKGSARSIPGFHIRDALDQIATQNPDVLQKFGGHAMAAGLTIDLQQLSIFQKLFDNTVRNQLQAHQLEEILLSDGELLPEELNLDMAQQIEGIGPWGQAFPEPLFDGEFAVIHQRLVGEKHLKLLLAPAENENPRTDAIAFNVDLSHWPDETIKKVNVAYQLKVNTYRGVDSVQLIVRYIEKI
jgi:single-stranded-DNA-specific exonuclease